MAYPPKTLLIRLAAAAAVLLSAQCSAQPYVAVSIKPLHSLVAGLMAGVGEPELLFKLAGSPHTLVMRPSQRRALANATLIIRVGPDLETALNRPLKSLDNDAVQIDVANAPGIEHPPARAGGAWDQHTGYEDHGHGSEGTKDPHILLSPSNAMAISRYVAQSLSTVDPVNASRYAANLERQLARIDALDSELGPQLQPVRAIPYLVFHDAYHIFEDHYGLSAVGAFSVAPGRAPGAKRLRELRQTITRTNARCVFTEPQFSAASASQVAISSGIRIGKLDPVGAALDPGPDQWFTLMRNLARSLTECLRQDA